MKLKMMETGNDFYPEKFEAICKELEQGQGIWLYCWCTGHARCAMVEYSYEQKLQEKYGDNLLEVIDDDGCTTGYKLQIT